MYFPKRNKITEDKKIDLKKIYKQKKGWKPEGIWYSCGKSWYNFIKDNDINDRLNKYIHSLYLKRKICITIKEKNYEKLLVIKNNDEFDAFFNKYKIFSKTLNYFLIDWKKVSNDYGGIEICPYLKDKRMVTWYYPWDVASGCIWNNDLIFNTKIVYEKDKKNIYQKI